MAILDYSTEAELSPTASEVELAPIRHRKTRQPIGYGRFARAADAIRFATEELPPELFLAAQLKVADQKFNSDAFADCTRASNIRWPDALRTGEQMNRQIRFDGRRATWGIRVAVHRDDWGPTLGASSDVVLYPDGTTVIDLWFGSCNLL